jgi:hypothetical protein
MTKSILKSSIINPQIEIQFVPLVPIRRPAIHTE